MVKKITKTAVIITILFSSTACSFASADGQKDTVERFFSCISQGDTDKAQELCTSDMQSELQLDLFDNSMELYMDEGSYGKTFADEAEEFKEYILASYIASHEIVDIETDKDRSIARVLGKYKDFNDMDFNDSDMKKLADDYASANKKDLYDIYLSDGYEAMMKKVYTDIAPDMFDALKRQVDNIEPQKLDVTFTLDKKDDKWLISDISQN